MRDRVRVRDRVRASRCAPHVFVLVAVKGEVRVLDVLDEGRPLLEVG